MIFVNECGFLEAIILRRQLKKKLNADEELKFMKQKKSSGISCMDQCVTVPLG